MDTILFNILGRDITIMQIVIIAFILLIYIYFLRSIILKNLENYLTSKNISSKNKKAFRIRSFILITALLVLGFQKTFLIDLKLWEINDQSLNLSLLIEAFVILSFASAADWLISHVFIKDYFFNRSNASITDSLSRGGIEEQSNRKASKLVQWIVYLYGVQLLLSRFGLDVILIHKEIKGEVFNIRISDVLIAILFIVISRLIVWFLTNVTLFRIYESKQVDTGTRFAVNQLITYVVYVVAVMMALEHLVSDMKIFYGGAAALLVGVGLGLQQTFNDLFSGLVLLFEQSVKVGDIIEMEGKVGRVLRIGLRSSLIETRQSVSLLVPNSKLVNQYVLNWTHNDDIVRFEINVGVAYGSDTQKVKGLLIKSIEAEPRILKFPEPFIRFNNFGDSSLDFTVYFFSIHAMNIEDLKSTVRFEIDRLFRENDVKIPFPQRDVWMKQ